MVNRFEKDLTSLWLAVCTVKEQAQWVDFSTKTTQFVEFDSLIDEPCRISFQSSAPTNKTDTISSVSQQIVLFIRPDVEIKAGSKIVVTQNNRTIEYKASGSPKVYSSHQEIPLEIYEDKA